MEQSNVEKRKIVEIRRGDEYRAKIESDLRPGELFSSVYRHAGLLVKEIITQSDNFSRDQRFKDRYGESLTRGYGNNVIIFCAGRGEGKTSAMQSFSSYLSKEIKGDKLFDKEDDLTKKYEFVVIESIDPSMMGEKDSVVAALLSRLFYKFDNTLQKYRDKGFDRDNLFYERNSVLELFSRCYQDINYFIEGKERDFSEDNLESLAGLGSRIYMRDHIYKLVDKYLRFEASDKKKYLVVQIDDADLFAGNVFKVCEEIRCFLAVPNIIVLMACDFEQLTMAIDQQYYEKHRGLKDFEYDRKIQDICKDMSLKYLEKVLPEDRRIYIPRFVLTGKAGTHKCIMRVYDNGKQKMMSDYNEYDQYCDDMYEQLLKLIYNKTGMVFEKADVPNSFMPRTFRELIQMMKMLFDMESVDGYKVIKEAFDGEEASAKINTENLRKNLKRFRYYFINYWCKVNLHIDEQRLIDKIYNNPSDISRIIRYLVPDSEAWDYTIDDLIMLIKYKELDSEIVESDRLNNQKLLDAIWIQLTLVLNKRFLESALNGSTLYDLEEIFDSPIDDDIKKYPLYFKVGDNIKEDSDNIVSFTNLFCIRYRDIIFDIWNPVLYFVYIFPDAKDVKIPGGIPGIENEIYKFFFCMKLVMFNPDVREHYIETLNVMIDLIKTVDLWDEKFEDLLQVYYLWIEDFRYLQDYNVEFDYYEIKDLFYGEMEKIFLSNDDNKALYIEENIKEIKKSIISLMNIFDDNGMIINNRIDKIDICVEKIYEVSDSYKDDNDIVMLCEIRRDILELCSLLFDILESEEDNDNDWSRGTLNYTMELINKKLYAYDGSKKEIMELLDNMLLIGRKLSKYYDIVDKKHDHD